MVYARNSTKKIAELLNLGKKPYRTTFFGNEGYAVSRNGLMVPLIGSKSRA